MKAVILAGGFGSRLSEETVLRPKPMVEVGGNVNHDTVANSDSSWPGVHIATHEVRGKLLLLLYGSSFLSVTQD